MLRPNMHQNKFKNSTMLKVSKMIHFLALLLGFQVSVFFVFFLLTEAGANLIEGKAAVIPMMLLIILSAGGYVYALSKPHKGSLVMITGGVLMMVYLLILAGISEYKMALIFGMPFIVPGLILYLNRYNALKKQ